MSYYSIIQNDLNHCYFCGQTPTDWHHVMNGPTKKASEKYGGMLHLCHQDHMLLHHNSIRLQQYKRTFQTLFLEEHSMDEWMRAFHKNYL